MKTKLKYTLIFFVFITGCNSDQLTKHLARETLRHSHPLVVFRGFIDLCYAENTGMAFSLMDNLSPSLRMLLLTCVPLFIVVCFSFLIWHFRTKKFTTLLPFALILSGASGNLFDRLMYGHVVDFIHFHIEDIFHWPIFNIADVLLFVGYLILFLQYGFRRNEKLNQKSL